MASETFPNDYEILAFSAKLTAQPWSADSPTSDPATTSPAAEAVIQLSYQDSYAGFGTDRLKQAGVVHHDALVGSAPVWYEDETNGTGGGISGTRDHHEHWVTADALVDADTSPSGGQSIFLHSNLTEAPSIGEVRFLAEYYLYLMESED